MNEVLPSATVATIGLDDPARCFNRELSWRGVNMRVLEEDRNGNQTLRERQRFL